MKEMRRNGLIKKVISLLLVFFVLLTPFGNDLADMAGSSGPANVAAASKTINKAASKTTEKTTTKKTTAKKDMPSPENGKTGLGSLKTKIRNELADQTGNWSVYVKNLSTNRYLKINNRSMPSASLIKLFVMNAAFYRASKGKVLETDTFNTYMNNMIRLSDNYSCNEITKMLAPSGSFDAGKGIVNNYNIKQGYKDTSFQAQMGLCDPSNVTSVMDCGYLLERMYRKTAVNDEKSRVMLRLLKAQTRLNKIPSVLPEGTISGNKTGEYPGVENDAAIVYTPRADYVLVVMSHNGTNSIEEIRNISSIVYHYFNDSCANSGLTKAEWKSFKPVLKRTVKQIKATKHRKFKTNAPKGVTVKWSVSDKKIGTINKNGYFTAKRVGKVKVTATFTASVKGVKKTKKKSFKLQVIGKKKIYIDPGHQIRANASQEPVGPGSSTTKMKVTGGCVGVATGIPEYVFTLDVGLKLRDALLKKGYDVEMSREIHDIDISNVQRAQKGNASGANICIRIHADSFTNSSLRGASVLYPSEANPYPIRDQAAKSRRLAENLLTEYCNYTGIASRGLYVRDDLSGTNWSIIPTVLIECGFFSNPQEDVMMNTPATQKKMVNGMVSAIDKYFGYK